MFRLDTARRPLEMEQRPRAVVSGAVTFSDTDSDSFHFCAYQPLTLFDGWNYANHAKATSIPVCAAVDRRKFKQDLPSEGTYIIVEGYFDDYIFDPANKLVQLTIIVWSLEVQCAARRRVALASTPSTSSSLNNTDDWSDYEGYGHESLSRYCTCQQLSVDAFC
jgi:hypothetical protein